MVPDIDLDTCWDCVSYRTKRMSPYKFLNSLFVHRYPLYTIFLPYYLEAHGADLGDGSAYVTYRDWAVSSVVGIFGPLLSMWMVTVRWFRSRRSMSAMAFICAVFCAAFTLVRTEAQNLAFSSMINFWLNALYGIVYS